MSVALNQTLPQFPIFEKFIIDKAGCVTQIDRTGKHIPLQHLSTLSPDFFSSAITFTRDTNHGSLLHRLIYLAQRIHSRIFGRTHNLDCTISHTFLIIKAGKRTARFPQTSFVISHADAPGICRDKQDYLSKKDVTELVIYRPIDEKMRDVCHQLIDLQTFVPKERQRTAVSPREVARFSVLDTLRSFIHNRKHEVCGKQGIKKATVRRTARLIADVLLYSQIQGENQRPQSFYCSAFATTIVQGTLFLTGLKDLSTNEIATFIRRYAGPDMSREELAQKIQESLLQDSPADPVAHALFLTYQQNKVVRYNGRFMGSAYLSKALDKMCMIKQAEAFSN